jgi:predicted transcriptional regulator of viral defense system
MVFLKHRSHGRSRRTLRKRLIEVAAGQAGYFSASQALEAGYSYPAQSYHASHENWLRVGRGIYRLPEWPSSPHEDLVRWSLWSGQKGVVSHESALAAHDLGDFNPAHVHLSVPLRFRAKAAGVVLHRAVVAPTEKQEHSGFWVTTPLRSLIDVASSSHDLDQVVTAVKEALDRGLVTPRRLRARAEEAGDRSALRIERALATVEATWPSTQPHEPISCITIYSEYAAQLSGPESSSA